MDGQDIIIEKIAVSSGNRHAKSFAEQLRSAESYEQSELWAYTNTNENVKGENEDRMTI